MKWIWNKGLIESIKNGSQILGNSPIGLGLYYGFRITFPRSPAGYFFILWVLIIEKDRKKRVAAIKGFIMGQLGLFIVIYYEPLFRSMLYLNEHEVSKAIISIFFIHFFSKIQSIWKIEIIKPTDRRTEFMIHLIYQVLNDFLIPNVRLVGLVNIFLSQCKNNNTKILFLTCSVLGWLIGLTFFMIFFVNFVEFILVQVRKSPFIQDKMTSRGFIRDLLHLFFDSKISQIRLRKPDRDMMLELKKYMAWILRIIIFLLVTSYYLQIGRKRPPILRPQLTTATSTTSEILTTELKKTATSTTSEILTTELKKTATSAMSAIEKTKAEIQKITEKKKEGDFCSEKNEADFCSEKSAISLFNRNRSNFSVFRAMVRKRMERYFAIFSKIFSYEKLFNYLTYKNEQTSHNPNIKGRRLARFYDYEKETKTQLSFPFRFRNIRILKNWWHDESAIPKNKKPTV